MRTAIALLVALTPITADAGDIREKVSRADEALSLTQVIDPDKSIFGIPYGITEDDFIKKLGKPMGYIRLTGTETGMLYGRSHLFLFEGGKLSGIRITSRILDWKISKSILRLTPFDRLQWKLNNGITKEMNLAEVKKILGDRLSKEKFGYQWYYTTNNAYVDLGFSHHTNEGDVDEAYIVSAILIRRK